MSDIETKPSDALAIIKKLEPRANKLVSLADGIEVKNDDDDQAASDLLATVRTLKKKTEADQEDINSDLKSAIKKIKALFDRALIPLKKADEILDGKIGKYRIAKKRKFEEDQRRQREEDDKIAAEAKRKLEEKAKVAEDRGQFDKAEDLREQAQMTAAGLFHVDEKLEISMRTNVKGIGEKNVAGAFDIKVKVIDDRQAVQLVLNGKLPIGAIEWKLGTIKRHIKDNHLTQADLPGIEITEDYNTAVRG